MAFGDASEDPIPSPAMMMIPNQPFRIYSYAQAEASIAQIENPNGRFANQLRFVAVHLYKATKSKPPKKLSFGPTDVMFYVLRNTKVLDKNACLITLEEVGELDTLYYATCGKLQECLYDVNIRLENHFIAPEDKYITYNSKGFGIDFATAGDFRATLLSYEAFLYSPGVFSLLRAAFREKHVRSHKTGSRPVLLDPRKMACGMIFASLKEAHRIAILDEQFEKQLENLPSDVADFHRQKRYSTGIHMRKKYRTKLSETNSRASMDSEDLSKGRDDGVEEKCGPLYLEYLDEDSVSSTSRDEQLEDQQLLLEQSSDPHGSDIKPDRTRGSENRIREDNSDEDDGPSPTNRISVSHLSDECSQIDVAMSLQGGNGVDDLLPIRDTTTYIPHEHTKTMIQPDVPELSCMCQSNCICVPLCAAEPLKKCACQKYSLFGRVAKRVNMDQLHGLRVEGADAEALGLRQQHFNQMVMNEVAQPPQVNENSAFLRNDSTVNASIPVDGPYTRSTNSEVLGRKPDIADIITKKLGGSLSIFAVELPNGERVTNWQYEWHDQMRAAMDARRQRYEPDPDWYFPPGAKYGRLSSRRVCDQHTLRKRVLDMTIGKITGKKAMFKPLKLKEELRSSTHTIDPRFD